MSDLSNILPRWLNVRRLAVALIAMGLLTVAAFPESALSAGLAGISAWITVIAAVVCGLTFWSKTRVPIGRLKFRYKIVRRNAAIAALGGFVFLVYCTLERDKSLGHVVAPTTSSDPDTVVVDCFCLKLKNERHGEALAPDSFGIPSTDWPNVDAVEKECIQPRLSFDQKQAEDAWLHARFLAPLQDPNGGVAGCTAAGYSVDESTPEPANKDLMNGARQAFCQDLADAYAAGAKDHSTPATDPKVVEAEARANESAMVAKFAARFHISNELADAALNRAAAEMKPIGKFAYECRDGAVVPPHTNFRAESGH
jgi:hypothetical protein